MLHANHPSPPIHDFRHRLPTSSCKEKDGMLQSTIGYGGNNLISTTHPHAALACPTALPVSAASGPSPSHPCSCNTHKPGPTTSAADAVEVLMTPTGRTQHKAHESCWLCWVCWLHWLVAGAFTQVTVAGAHNTTLLPVPAAMLALVVVCSKACNAPMRPRAALPAVAAPAATCPARCLHAMLTAPGALPASCQTLQL